MKNILTAIERARTTPQNLAERARIILGAAVGKTNVAIAGELDIDPQRVRRWRTRWAKSPRRLEEAVANGASDKDLRRLAIDLLSDAYRAGIKPKFSAEQMTQIIGIACEDPKETGYPVSHWTPKEVRVEAIRRGVVESISVRHVDRFLKGGRPTPP